MKKQEESDKKDPKPSTSGQGGAGASSGGDFGDAEQYQELNPIGTGELIFNLVSFFSLQSLVVEMQFKVSVYIDICFTL